MSQPPFEGVPPTFSPPPQGYGGYGGELQSYGQPGYDQTGYGQTGHGQPYPGTPVAPRTQPWQVQPVPAPAGTGQLGLPHPMVPPQRPAVIGLAATLAISASLQWICVLSFSWLVATAGARQLGTSGVEGGLYHLLNRFNYRMLDGLAWPLYLFPLASFVLGFLLLARRSWARLAFTLVGGAALAWSALWLRHDLVWWLAPAGYVAVAVLVLWTRPASRWYAWRPSDPAGRQPA